VMDYHTEESYPNLVDAMGLFRNGLQCYRKRQWAKAAELFDEVLRLNPNDQAAHMYIERCGVMADMPPPEDWDGSYVMETK